MKTMTAGRVAPLSAAAAPFLLAACGGHSQAPQDRPAAPKVAVEVAAARAMELPVYEEVVGTVRPRLGAAVSAKVTGRILKVDASPGQRVRSGDPLVEIEAGELDAAVAAAKATSVQTARVLDRYKNLLATGAATQSEYDRAESSHEVAMAGLKQAETMAANATVTAPFDGTVTRRFMEPGDLAVPGKPIFALEDPEHLRLEVDVAESIAGKIKLGDRFRVAVAGAGLTVEATVAEVAPSADAGSRTFLVKLDLPDDDGLRAGQFGRAFVPRGSRPALVVPLESVVERGQLDYVFVASGEDARAVLRIVRTGGGVDGGTEVLSGVEAGEQVILRPGAALRDGQPLELSVDDRP